MKIKEIENKIISSIKKSIKTSKIEVVLEYPLNADFGDFALCLSPIIKEFKKSPTEVGNLIKKELLKLKFIKSIEIIGIYLNITIKEEILFSLIIKDAGKIEKEEKKKNILIEYLEPNTNKPLHIGHLRNGFLGVAISNIFKEKGHKDIKINLVNNRGVHICKSMLAYKKWGEGKTPKSEKIKGDHFVGNYYVKYTKEEEKNPLLKEEVNKMLFDWERGDKETISLWKKMNSWVYKGFKESYKNFGFKFDKTYYESDIYNLGKDIIKKGVKKGVFYIGEEGGIIFDLDEKEFGLTKDREKRKLTLLRKDGTSLYITQDIGLAVKKSKEYKFDKSIHIVGLEQNYYFKTLFSVLKALEYGFAYKMYHLSYGMVYLPEGKMKSREGKIIDADNLFIDIKERAKKEILKRYNNIKDLNERAEKIALGAIKFQFLFINPSQDIHFDMEKSVSFDGATGPYLQYSYARAKSILRKSKIKTEKKNINFSLLKEKEEVVLIRKLLYFNKETSTALENLNPSRIANYLYELSKEFNRFYNKYSVLDSQKKLREARISLVFAVSKTLKKGLDILGIPVLEEM